MVRTHLALRSNIVKVGDIVSVNSGPHDPLTLKFGQIDQTSSLELIDLYISRFAEKCGMDRLRSKNNVEIDKCRQIQKYRLKQRMAAVAAETAAARGAVESADAAQSVAEIAAKIAARGYGGGRTFGEYMEHMRKMSRRLEDTILRCAYAARRHLSVSNSRAGTDI